MATWIRAKGTGSAAATSASCPCLFTTSAYAASASSSRPNSPSLTPWLTSALATGSRNPFTRPLVAGFQLPTAPPTGCEVQSATLRMHAKSARDARTIQALRVTGAWTESGVTWANQPAKRS